MLAQLDGIEELLEVQKNINPLHFDSIAYTILNRTILKLNNHSFRICEIEFYLNSKDHPDKYTHSDPDQLKYGYWYFHKYRDGRYKGGNYKGMDIALGNEPILTYCGILIRSIYNLKEKIMIEGPCRSVNKVLELYKINSISEFIEDKILSVHKNSRNFCLIDAGYKVKPMIIYKGSRIGLSDNYPNYRNRDYRYLIYNNLIKKQKKSRVKCHFNDIKIQGNKSQITNWL